jgi:hypothetical protein
MFNIESEMKTFFAYLAWIVSKVKAVAPVLPSGDATTVIPVMADPLTKVSGGSMAIPSANKLTTKRSGKGRRKTTTLASIASETATPSIEEELEIPNGDDAAKAAIKRVIRALVNRQY